MGDPAAGDEDGDAAEDGADVGLDSAALSAAPPSAASSVTITEPFDTRSPSLTLISLIVPGNGAGTSTVALSDSSVTSGASLATTSPGLTKISMTGMFLKSPMSGTGMSRVAMTRA